MSKKDKEFIFNPNMQPKLSGIDRYIKDDDGNCYTSREEEIIDRYLLQEESLEIDVFDMSNYDISTICYVANCGLNFTNESFRMVIHEILLCVIDIWKYTKRNYNAHEIFDVYQEHEIIELFQREMIQTQDDAKMSRQVLEDGTYNNPYNVEPIALTKKKQIKILLVQHLLGWVRFLF